MVAVCFFFIVRVSLFYFILFRSFGRSVGESIDRLPAVRRGRWRGGVITIKVYTSGGVSPT